MGQVIEQIARQWFDTEPSNRTPDWDEQPESVRAHYLTLARQFWADPGKLTRELQAVAISTRQMTSNIERSTKAWVD